MKKIFIVPTLLLLTFSSCDKNESMNAETVDSVAVDEVANMDMAIPQAEAVKAIAFAPPVVNEDKELQELHIEKKLIKEGELRFKTSDIAATRKVLITSLEKLDGYVSEEGENNYNGQKEITLNTRIPAKNFDAFLSVVSNNAESIDSKNIRIKDVTTEFIDVTTQLANKKKLEARYLELLNKSSKVADLLEVENKLTEIRSSIESTQGQLNYLSKQVAYSTLSITFYSKQTVQDNGQTFGYKIKNALVSGWYTLGGLFFGFIAWWPIWLALLAIVFAFRKWRNRSRKD